MLSNGSGGFVLFLVTTGCISWNYWKHTIPPEHRVPDLPTPALPYTLATLVLSGLRQPANISWKKSCSDKRWSLFCYYAYIDWHGKCTEHKGEHNKPGTCNNPWYRLLLFILTMHDIPISMENLLYILSLTDAYISSLIDDGHGIF